MDPATPAAGAPPQAIVVAGNPWQLGADPASVEAAARAWREYRNSAHEIGEAMEAAGRRVDDLGWHGDTADAYREHRRRLSSDITTAGDLGQRVGDALERAARSLSAADGQLREALAHLSSRMRVDVGPDSVTLYPATTADLLLVNQAVEMAARIRSNLDLELGEATAAIDRTRPDWRMLATTWVLAVSTDLSPYPLPPEARGTQLIEDGDQVIVSTGPGNDRVVIGVSPATGQYIAVINGTYHHFPAGTNITIRTGEGNDSVFVDPNTKVRVTLIGGGGDDILYGGAGDDVILGNKGNDRIMAQRGNDQVFGGAGRDYIDGADGHDMLDAGTGADVVYGLNGDDRIVGGEGRDYLDGARGNDRVDGGAGGDVLVGGRGDDTIRGGGGADVSYGSFGRDTIDGGSGSDTAYAQRDDVIDSERTVIVELTDLPVFVRVEGGEAFRQRFLADWDFLLASPRGQAMLTALQGLSTANGNSLTIVQSHEPGGWAARDWDNATPGQQSRIGYNPYWLPGSQSPPVAVLYHEEAHVYDFQNGTADYRVYRGADIRDHGFLNLERVSVGLPIDHDGNPATPEQHDETYHPYVLTENGLLEEMGLPTRPHYNPF